MKQTFITTFVEPRSQELNLNKDGLVYYSKDNIKARCRRVACCLMDSY